MTTWYDKPEDYSVSFSSSSEIFPEFWWFIYSGFIVLKYNVWYRVPNMTQSPFY